VFFSKVKKKSVSIIAKTPEVLALSLSKITYKKLNDELTRKLDKKLKLF